MEQSKLENWFNVYGISHRHPTNRILHKICVPLIFVSILGLLSLIRISPTAGVWLSLAAFGAVPALVFYATLGSRPFLFMVAVWAASLFLLEFVETSLARPWLAYVAVFVIGWIGQGIGHAIEGKRPSFFHDLSFLLIGPLWVAKSVFRF